MSIDEPLVFFNVPIEQLKLIKLTSFNILNDTETQFKRSTKLED